MFGRKQKRIRELEDYILTHNELVKDSIKGLKIINSITEELQRTIDKHRDDHNAFAIVEDYLLKLSEELRQDGSKIVYREKHKNSEGNIFVSEKDRDATQIDNITRALYEIEKSERRKNK